jgi:hypothetical protein
MARRETNAPTLRTHRRDLRAFLAVVAVGMGTGALHVDGARTGLRGHAGQRLSARRPHASSLPGSSSCRHDVTFAITPLVFVRVTESVDSARNLGSWHPRLRISPCLPPNCFSRRLARASHAGCEGLGGLEVDHQLELGRLPAPRRRGRPEPAQHTPIAAPAGAHPPVRSARDRGP